MVGKGAEDLCNTCKDSINKQQSTTPHKNKDCWVQRLAGKWRNYTSKAWLKKHYQFLEHNFEGLKTEIEEELQKEFTRKAAQKRRMRPDHLNRCPLDYLNCVGRTSRSEQTDETINCAVNMKKCMTEYLHRRSPRKLRKNMSFFTGISQWVCPSGC